MDSAGGVGTVEVGERRARRDRVSGAAVLGLVASIAAASALFMTERAGGAHRWWWIVGCVVALPTGLAVFMAPRRRRAVVGLTLALATVTVGVVLEQRPPITEDRVIHRFDELVLPAGYSFLEEPYVGDDAIGVGGYFVSVAFEHPADTPSDAADEVCAALRTQEWKMQCRYDLFSSEDANQEFFDGDAEYADLWGIDGRFRVAVEFTDQDDRGILIVKTDQPPLNLLPFYGE
jgi:hypothetical protein